VLICSNLIGPAKIAQLDLPLNGIVSFGPACCFFFPISYVFDDSSRGLWLRPFPTRDLAGFAGLAFALSWPGSWSACPRRLFGRTRRPTKSPSLDLANCSASLIGSCAGSSSLVRAGEDENSHAGPVAVDAHHRLDDLGRASIP